MMMRISLNCKKITIEKTLKTPLNSKMSTSDNDLKTRILSAINEFFALDNWEFGQSFHFGESLLSHFATDFEKLCLLI